MTIRIRPLPNPGDQMDMFSWLREAEASLIKAGTPSWSDINFVGSKLSDIASRSHTVLSDIGSNTHSQIDSMLASLQSQINATNSLVASQPWTAHAALTSGVHGAIGSVVGTTDAQPLTNKTYLGINTASGDQYDAITVRGTSVNNTAITLQKLDGTDKVQSSISTTGNGNVSVYDSSGSYNSSINGDQIDISHGSNHVNIYSDGQIALNNTVGANSYIQIPQQGIINIGPGNVSGDWRIVCPSAGGNLLTQRLEVDGSYANGVSSSIFMDFNQETDNLGSITGGPFYSFNRSGAFTYTQSVKPGYDYVANFSGSNYLASASGFNATYPIGMGGTKNTTSIWMTLSDVSSYSTFFSACTNNSGTPSGYAIRISSSGIRLLVISNNTYDIPMTGTSISNSTPFHIMMQYEASTHIFYFWINGYYQGYYDNGGMTGRYGAGTVYIGAGPIGFSFASGPGTYLFAPIVPYHYDMAPVPMTGSIDEMFTQHNTILWTPGINYSTPDHTRLVWITKHTITP